MTLGNRQILVKGYENASYEARRFTQKDFAFLQIYCHLKSLLNNLENISVHDFFG